MENQNLTKKILKWLTIVEFIILFIAFLANQTYQLGSPVSQTYFYLRAIGTLVLNIFYFPFILLLIAQTFLIFNNLFSKNLVKSSLIALLVTILQPIIVLNVYSKISYYLRVFSSSSRELFSAPPQNAIAYSITHPTLPNDLNWFFIIVEIALIVLFLFTIKKEVEIYINGKRKIISFVGTCAVFVILFGGYASAESMVKSRLNTANIEYRLNYAGISGTTPLEGFTISNLIYTTGNYEQVKFEFSATPSQVIVGTDLMVFAALPSYLSPNDHLQSSCVIQKDNQTNLFYCIGHFSSTGPNFTDKSIYSFYLNTSNIPQFK